MSDTPRMKVFAAGKLKPPTLGKIKATNLTHGAIARIKPKKKRTSMSDFKQRIEDACALIEAADRLTEVKERDPDGIKVTIQTKSGKRVTGRVHGSGGVVREMRQIRHAIEQATQGYSLRIFEPKKGHAKVWTGSDQGLGEPFEIVDLRGARIV